MIIMTLFSLADLHDEWRWWYWLFSNEEKVWISDEYSLICQVVFSAGNLAAVFRGGDPTAPITAYVPPKQPKKGISTAKFDHMIFCSVLKMLHHEWW